MRDARAPGPDAPGPDVDACVAELSARYWDAFVEAHPIVATAYGDRRHDDRVDDLRPEAIAATRARFATLLDEVRPLAEAAAAGEAGDPGAGSAVTAAALVGVLEGDIAEIDGDYLPWTVDALEGPQVQIFNVESYHDAQTPAEGQRMVERWRAMGGLIDQQTANLRDALVGGRVAVRTPIQHVIDALDEALAQPDEESALLNPARVSHDDWPATDVAAFRERLHAAVATEIRPALERLRNALRDEILPAARSDDEPGLLHVAGAVAGDAYGSLIHRHTSLDISADELHRVGQDEVARINDELERLGERVLRTSDRVEILRRLRTDPELHFATEDEIADKAESALARAQAAVPAWFGVLPRASCSVVRMGVHEAKHGTIAYYRQPAPDGSRPGQYFINTTEPETRPRYEAEALAYHESVPGHHLQIAIGQEVAGLPEFRRHLGVTAFWEGWGLYTERLADEMGLYSGDLDRIGILSFDAWRACRLVVDTGMHALGWTRRQAIDFMTANSAIAPNNIANEVDRYIVWPAQALAYKTGQLEILRLRDEARGALGTGFDIRAFHDALLENGALGLGAVREAVARRLGVGLR